MQVSYPDSPRDSLTPVAVQELSAELLEALPNTSP
jgi:hypothetical protein